MVLEQAVARIPYPMLNAVARRASKSRWVRKTITEIMVDRYAYALPVRPRAISMASDYPTWNGLVDRRYSGRHGGPCPDSDLPREIPMADHVDLFMRKEFKPAKDTSILFAMFAQWFTDGFLRTKWEPPGQKTYRFNESNHDIDLCQIYGQSEDQTRLLRALDPRHPGRLKFQMIGEEMWPSSLFQEVNGSWEIKPEYLRRDPSGTEPGSPGLYTAANFARIFGTAGDDVKSVAMAVGLEHGNSTIGHVVMNTIFLREHNRNAGIIATAHPDWDDERVFQTARNVTIVVLLHIVISDYITHIAPIDFQLEVTPGIAERKGWYRTNWIPVEFALLYRWHDLIPDKLEVEGDDLLAHEFRNATAWIRRHGVGAVIKAATEQAAGRIGLGNTHRFLAEDAANGPNVKRLSIEMARACRLPGFNAYRKLCGLKPYSSFMSLTRDRDLSGKLTALYGHVDNLDWFTGLFAEGYDEEDLMGELMVSMVANDAFTQALTNPLLARSVYGEAAFSDVGFKIVQSTRRLTQVIVRNTGISRGDGDSFKIQAAAIAGG